MSDTINKKLPKPEKGDVKLKKRQAQIALPMKKGETRFCMFPFQKPNIFDGFFSLCCASSLRAYPEPWQYFEEGSIEPGWCSDYMVRLRKSLLLGDQNNMITACRLCERAPAVSPETMQLHVALHSYTYKPCPEVIKVCKNLEYHFPAYQMEMKDIGVAAYSYPDFIQEAES